MGQVGLYEYDQKQDRFDDISSMFQILNDGRFSSVIGTSQEDGEQNEKICIATI